MIPERKRVYIVVKTYPTISEKYAELVCTAGILEDGSWIRLYPMPFRMLDKEQQYPKYTWINIDVTRKQSDFRSETYKPTDVDSIIVETQTGIDWDKRREIIFKNKKTYTNLKELISESKKGLSLAIFKPTRIVDFTIEVVEREWDKKKIDKLIAKSQQLTLFEDPCEIKGTFKVVQKVPYKFSYKFEDDAGQVSTLMIEDWEIGMLYFNCLKRANGDESVAVTKVKQKYFDEFIKKDLYFFLGTTLKFHNISPNPFIIIGVFYPPIPPLNPQLTFDL